MTHEAHWYLSATIFFALAWFNGVRCIDILVEDTRTKKRPHWQVAINGLMAFCLFFLVFAFIRVIGHLSGIFDDMTLKEYCWVLGMGGIAGVVTALRFYLGSKEKLS